VEIKLKPQESYYLNRPVLSDPVEMLKYALLGLDSEGCIDIFYKKIYINRNAKYMRSRMFVRLGAGHSTTNPYTSAEALLVSLIDKPELRLFELRRSIAKSLDNEIGEFKKRFVYNDLSSKKFILLRWLLSSPGRDQISNCRRLVKEIDKDLDALLKNRNDLRKKMEELGSNIIFLEDTTLKKLGKKVIDLEELNKFFDPKGSGTSAYISYGSFSGANGGGYSGGGGGWGGFGGGGSGGSW